MRIIIKYKYIRFMFINYNISSRYIIFVYNIYSPQAFLLLFNMINYMVIDSTAAGTITICWIVIGGI